MQNLRPNKGDKGECRGNGQGPPARRLPMQEWPATNERKHHREHEAEAPVGAFRRGTALNLGFQEGRHRYLNATLHNGPRTLAGTARWTQRAPVSLISAGGEQGATRAMTGRAGSQ